MLVTLTKMARILEIGPSALQKASVLGKVTRNEDGTFDVERARREYLANTDPVKSAHSKVKTGRKPIGPKPVALTESAAEGARRLVWEKVRALQQETDRRDGHLVEVEAVNAWVAGMIMAAREKLTRIGSELGDALAREDDAAACAELVNDRIGQALEELQAYREAA